LVQEYRHRSDGQRLRALAANASHFQPTREALSRLIPDRVNFQT
jgi:hypothetical protein